ncbi:conserved hypothetical protein [Leishmania braziliensis MHOM/BR/75/M2904]|uniref:Uncharacterized protein n=3 Tax=Viannia TaxID=37616 RepID=A4HGJ7_LEIBR|nr:conserved hypothetical protein [Leishmania braziliensis MHOM/BR/75/M2904]CAJ2475867.1 unnamed protein product [Leishmania braziliensis]CAM39691.2 conserved hypothetical protein [Leishmania braziliensis MHOM/BR/75/M2904]
MCGSASSWGMRTAYFYDARRRVSAHTRAGTTASAAQGRRLSVLFVRSELSGDRRDGVTGATRSPTALSSSAATRMSSTVPVAAASGGADFVDVDALNSADTDGAEDVGRAAVVPGLTQRVGHIPLRDAVVLSYHGASDDYAMHRRTVGASYGDGAPPPVDELLSVATEDSRVLLRRSGLSTEPRTAGVPAVHMWRGCNEDTGEEAKRAPAYQSRGADQSFGWNDCAGSLSNASSAIPTTVSSVRWAQEASVLLEHTRGTLHRVRPRSGTFSARVSSSSLNQQRPHVSSNSWSHCQADFVALSTSSVSLVQSREYGAELAAVQHTVFACEMIANATCMDDWGPHSTVVGFSDGTLRVVDWRTPARGSSVHTGDAVADDDEKHVALRTHVPQPPWMRHGGRSATAATSVAGVLSCCAFEDSFRIVCGLGDASGAVVMADLRRPDSGDRLGRRRTRAEQQAAQHLFAETGGQSPTGRAVTDIQRDPSCFGRIGLVDMTGTAVLTNVAALEVNTGSSAAVAVKRSRTKDGAGVPSSLGSTAVARPRLPPPPSPWSVLERLGSLSPTASRSAVLTTILHSIRGGPQRAVTDGGNAQGEWFCSPITAHPRPRCAFSDDGRHFAHIAAKSVLTATLRCAGAQWGAVMGGSSFSRTPGVTATHVQLASSLASGHAALMPSPFIAVSCVDGLMCFDTGDGHTLAIPIV